MRDLSLCLLRGLQTRRDVFYTQQQAEIQAQGEYFTISFVCIACNASWTCCCHDFIMGLVRGAPNKLLRRVLKCLITLTIFTATTTAALLLLILSRTVLEFTLLRSKAAGSSKTFRQKVRGVAAGNASIKTAADGCRQVS